MMWKVINFLWSLIVFKTTANQVNIESFVELNDLKLTNTNGSAWTKTICYNNSIYTFGGTLSSYYMNKNVFKYNLQDGNSWKLINTAYTGFRTYFGGVMVNSKLYMFGVLTDYYIYSLAWTYDFETNFLDFSPSFDLPSDYRVLIPCATYDTKRNFIYLLGGYYYNSETTTVSIDESQFFQIFDVQNDTFIDINNNNNNNKYGFNQLDSNDYLYSRVYGQCSMDDINDRIYYFGGYNIYYSVLNSILCYDINTHQWFELDTGMSIDKGDFGLLLIDRSVYIIAGISGEVGRLNTVEVFDLDSQTTNILDATFPIEMAAPGGMYVLLNKQTL